MDKTDPDRLRKVANKIRAKGQELSQVTDAGRLATGFSYAIAYLLESVAEVIEDELKSE